MQVRLSLIVSVVLAAMTATAYGTSPGEEGLLPGASANAGDFRIEYTSSGLTSVEVTPRRQLRYAWHTPRFPFENDVPVAARQSLDEFDSHTAEVWLTKTELDGFRQWVEQNGILDLKTEFPESERQTYGSAFHSSLTVELDGKKISLAWTEDTKVPDSLAKAVGKLIEMCDGIRRSRK